MTWVLTEEHHQTAKDNFAKSLGRMVRTVFQVAENIVDAYSSYLQGVTLLCNSHGLHCDEAPLVHSSSNICKSTRPKLEFPPLSPLVLAVAHGLQQASLT